MKGDELELVKRILASEEPTKVGKAMEVSKQIGMSKARLEFILVGWFRKFWFDYNLTICLKGWVTQRGLEQLRTLISKQNGTK